MREVHTCQSKGGNFSYSNVLKAGNSGLARTVRNKTGAKVWKTSHIGKCGQFVTGVSDKGPKCQVLVLGFIQCFLMWSQCFLLMMSVNVLSYHNTSQDCGIGE